MEMKNICGKIPLDLHEKVREEIERTESSTQKFILKVIEEHFSGKGEINMEKRKSNIINLSTLPRTSNATQSL